MSNVIEKVKRINLRSQVKWRGFMRKLETKMTPGWELLLTIFFGWTGIRWWIRGRIWVGLRLFLTFGLFGIGWIVDIITCLTAYLQYDKLKKNKEIDCYSITDTNYNKGVEVTNCVFHCDAYAWLGDIDSVVMHNESKYLNDILDDYTIAVDTEECYRLRLYVLSDRLVATNVEGIEFEYTLDAIKSIDVYADVCNILGNNNYIYTVRFNDNYTGVALKRALDRVLIANNKE